MEYGIPSNAPSTTEAFSNTFFSGGGGVPSAMASDMAVYTMPGGMGTLGMVAPKGWTCKAIVGADGSEGMTISGPNGAAVELSIGNGQGPTVSMACPYFQSAQSMPECGGEPDVPVIGETVNQLSQTEVEVIDPPGVQGAGPLSGGNYTDESVEMWIPGSELAGPAGQGDQGYALRTDCAMASSEAATCRAILNFTSYWYASPSLAGF